MHCFRYAEVQVCRGAGMLSPRGARYAGAVGRYLGVQVSMGTIMTMFRYAGIRICRYASIQVCRYTGMQVCRYAGVQVCRGQ